MSNLQEFNVLAKSVKKYSGIVEFVIGILFIAALVYAYLESSVLLLIVALLIWIIHILLKIGISIQLNLLAVLVMLKGLDK